MNDTTFTGNSAIAGAGGISAFANGANGTTDGNDIFLMAA